MWGIFRSSSRRKAKSMTYYLPPNPLQDAKNASGGGYHSDGRVMVVFLK